MPNDDSRDELEAMPPRPSLLRDTEDADDGGSEDADVEHDGSRPSPPLSAPSKRLNDDLLGTVFKRRHRIGALRAFAAPVRVVFGADDRYLNPHVALQFAALFPNSELTLIPGARHYVQVDEPERVACLITDGWPPPR